MIVNKPNLNKGEDLWVATYDGAHGQINLYTDQVEWYTCDQCNIDFYVERPHVPTVCPFCGM